MFKKITLLAVASLIFTGIGCSQNGAEKTAPVVKDNTNDIPLNVSDGSKLGVGAATLTSPEADAVLQSPFLVAGTADWPGEKAYVRVKNAEGKNVIEAWTAIRQDKDNVGKFSVFISFNFSGTKEGTVEVFGQDSSGAEVGLQSVPVVFDVTSSEDIEAIPEE